LTKAEQETLPKFRAAFEQYKTLRARLIELSLAGKDDQAMALADGEARQAQSEARTQLRTLIDINAREAESEEKLNQDAAAATKTKILIFIAAGILFALGMGLFIARAIGKPLRDIPGMNWVHSPIRSAS
jgi:methyl-accepting chemotaxis protein